MNIKRVAIVYDWTNQFGGAERVISQIAEVFPKADFYTGMYSSGKTGWQKPIFNKIVASFIGKLPLSSMDHRIYALLYPLAFENFCFDGYDLVISVTGFSGKYIITKPGTFHFCYCLTPTRFLWMKDSSSNIYKTLFPILSSFRSDDVYASKRPDVLYATCKNVARRIHKFYGFNSKVIYPGVDLRKFTLGASRNRQEYFLLVSRLVEYKRIDVLINAFNKLKKPLVIVGTGRLDKKLKNMANDNITFCGEVDEESLVRYYQNCQAVIFPPDEDFGLVPIEAQACGRPVLAFGKGGARETILAGETGEFFANQDSDSLLEVLSKFQTSKYKEKNCRDNAEKFSKEKFLAIFKQEILESLKNYQGSINC